MQAKHKDKKYEMGASNPEWRYELHSPSHCTLCPNYRSHVTAVIKEADMKKHMQAKRKDMKYTRVH